MLVSSVSVIEISSKNNTYSVRISGLSFIVLVLIITSVIVIKYIKFYKNDTFRREINRIQNEGKK